MFNINDRDKRDMTVEKKYVTWEQVEDFITKLTPFIKEHNFTGVYGPARGGVVFACIVSNRFGLPYLGAPQKDCLIVDDIVDSGRTAEAWKDKGYTIASMYYNKKSIIEPDFWIQKKQDLWVVFPWESNNYCVPFELDKQYDIDLHKELQEDVCREIRNEGSD